MHVPAECNYQRSSTGVAKTFFQGTFARQNLVVTQGNFAYFLGRSVARLILHNTMFDRRQPLV